MLFHHWWVSEEKWFSWFIDEYGTQTVKSIHNLISTRKINMGAYSESEIQQNNGQNETYV